jgi:hypothetical protein
MLDARSWALTAAVLLVVGCVRRSAPPSPADAADGSSTPGASASVESASPFNPTPLAPAAVEAFRNPAHLPEYAGPTGSVEGTIVVMGDPAPEVPGHDFARCPVARDTYGKLFRDGPARPDGSRPLADALVAVTGYSGFYVPEHSEARTVTIRNCAFDTRTVDMTIGQRLEVANKSTALYAPALAQAPMPALMVAPPNADPVKLYPLKPGYYTLIDRMGADYMTADVYALAYPLHTVTGLDGHYRIDGVPVGKIDVDVRLPAIRQNASKSVEVKMNVVERVDLQLKYSAAAPTAATRDAAAIQPLLVK